MKIAGNKNEELPKNYIYIISSKISIFMSKVKTVYRCEQCGADHLKWAGQCSECGEWNCLNEVKLEPTTAHRARPKVGVMRVKSPILQRLIKSLFLMRPVCQQALANLTECLAVVW